MQLGIGNIANTLLCRLVTSEEFSSTIRSMYCFFVFLSLDTKFRNSLYLSKVEMQLFTVHAILVD